ncbi:MarR family transcriptional regulator [Limosilactobacillus sp. STM2_1]|uniref:MarR family transcriptional regulator n=1 Tax=Limosilactobacillus rudii TaxID=2759755 RepID=A0A7W3UKK3_9LACO|nr:MarR family transcriptional regulator [Limosilactobacillus rudii]MBB1079198.1 MarR family transcriptional regulator [Limosilactobacillus rudii]MBB1097287.1 MarR family transcriptional regulator [Limosilactobacillus rudii]MCD7134396.1 MarR family transcriptional regulator [Limosilactobacillus rudii]
MSKVTVDKIQKIIQLLRAEHSNIHGSKEQQWIQEHITDQQLKKIVLNLSIVSFHILSVLENGELTGIEIAEKLSVTRGGITRAAKKLLQYQLITAKKHTDNQKKLYYSLTDQGRAVALVHDEMHRTIKKQIVAKLVTKYSDQELQVVADFLTDLYEFEKEFS